MSRNNQVPAKTERQRAHVLMSNLCDGPCGVYVHIQGPREMFFFILYIYLAPLSRLNTLITRSWHSCLDSWDYVLLVLCCCWLLEGDAACAERPIRLFISAIDSSGLNPSNGRSRFLCTQIRSKSFVPRWAAGWTARHRCQPRVFGSISRSGCICKGFYSIIKDNVS